jgi:two-component system, NarL family, nitrate/nitrite response regulator NarL
MTTSVLLIDDHALFRKGVTQLIQADAELSVAAEASSGEEGLKLARELNPSVVLIDLNMKGMGGLDILRELKRIGSTARCIMLTVSDEQRDVVDALRAGADGYLLKDLEPEDLCERLKSAVRGNVVLDAGVANVLAQSFRAAPAPASGLEELTDREREILEHIAIGRTNKEVGRALGITEGTVKVHMKHLLRKLKLRGRVEAVVWALERLPR